MDSQGGVRFSFRDPGRGQEGEPLVHEYCGWTKSTSQLEWMKPDLGILRFSPARQGTVIHESPVWLLNQDKPGSQMNQLLLKAGVSPTNSGCGDCSKIPSTPSVQH